MESDDSRTIDIKNFRPPKGSAGRIVGIVVLVVVALLLWTTVYTVDPEEQGVVLRFGQFVRTTNPGLNFKLPSPLEVVYKVPVQRQLKEEFGFRTQQAGVRTAYSPDDFAGESLMLTGDLNVAVVEWTTQYRVNRPELYLFEVRNPRQTFRDMNEAVMRSVVGDRSVNEVLTVGRLEVATEVGVRLQEMCDQYENGIKVEQVVLQDVNPPDPVKPSFNEVNQAEQERERSINEARSEYNRVIPRARGEAKQTVEQAEGYAVERVNSAKGDVVLFEELLTAYNRAPDVTRQRLYLETMREIYPKVKDKVILDRDLEGLLPLLQLSQGGAQ